MRSAGGWVLCGLIWSAQMVAGLWSAGCAPRDRDAASGPVTLGVEYDGCAAVVPGPVCYLGQGRRLSLWVPAAPDRGLEVFMEGTQVEVAPVEVAGGRRVVVHVPEKATRLLVRVVAAEVGEGLGDWTLLFRDLPDWLKKAEQLAAEGETEAARQLLETTLKAAPIETSVASHHLARWGHRSAKVSEEVVLVHRAAGNTLAEVRDATVLVHSEILGRRFSHARQRLAGLRLPPGSPADAAYLVAFYRSVLAAEVGDYRSALRQLDVAVALAQRLGMSDYEWYGQQWRGLQLRNLGRAEEAAEVFRRLGETAPRPCEKAALLTNQAWSLFLALEAGESADDPLPLLDAAEEVAARAGCTHLRLDLLLNRALVLAHRGRYDQVTELLSEVGNRLDEATPLHRLWWLDIEARLALHNSRPQEALELYSRLEALATTAFAPEGQWRAAVGQARAHTARGDVALALAALEEAEERLDDETLQIPLHEERERFVAQRQAATLLHLDLLLQADRDWEAMAVARRSRGRVLRALWRRERLARLSPQRRLEWDRALAEYLELRAELDAASGNDWQLPADALDRVQNERQQLYRALRRALDGALAVVDAPPPDAAGSGEPGLPALAADAVHLAYHPLSRGWVGFAAMGRRLRTHRFELEEDVRPPPEALAEVLLEPFRAEILRATRVRVLPYGFLREIDFHSLPFDNDVLVASRPVVYGVDVVSPNEGHASTSRGLVVADPQGDLPASRREAVAVGEALESHNWQVAVLQGAEATAGNVRNALSAVELLHYAGHGTYGGGGGWDSALPLAHSTRFTMGDILLLPRTPAWVILSGCETGRSSIRAPLESLGLAQAFVVSGARGVVAATRPVRDRGAAALFDHFYQDWYETPDLPRLLQQAQLAWRRNEPGGDWASFRVVQP